jgi:hypothetical protein
VQVKKNSTASKPKVKQQTLPGEHQITAAERRRWIKKERKAEREISDMLGVAGHLAETIVAHLQKEEFCLADGPVTHFEAPLFKALTLLHQVQKLLGTAAGEYEESAMNTSRELAGQEPIRHRTRDQIDQMWWLSFCK